MKLLLNYVSSSIVCINLFLFTTTIITSVDGRSGKIVGGTPVLSLTEFPFFAYPASNYLCGASLIHGDILITAAHCGDVVWKNGVYLGGTRLNGQQPSVYYSANKTVIYPSYDIPAYSNDIMLIKINGFAMTAPLALANTDTSIPMIGQVLTAIGYGRTSFGGSISYDLLKVNFNTVSYEECAKNYTSILINDTMVCSGVPEGGKDTCQGDSGGPILMNGTNTIIGLVSFGDGCANASTPAVNTRVSFYNKWIHDTICSISSQPPSSCVVPVPVPVPVPIAPKPVAITVPAPIACTAKGRPCITKSTCCGPIKKCVLKLGGRVCG